MKELKNTKLCYIIVLSRFADMHLANMNNIPIDFFNQTLLNKENNWGQCSLNFDKTKKLMTF